MFKKFIYQIKIFRTIDFLHKEMKNRLNLMDECINKLKTTSYKNETKRDELNKIISKNQNEFDKIKDVVNLLLQK